MAASTNSVQRVFATLCEPLDGRQYDIAVVATPAPLHVPMARRLAGHRCHILIERHRP